MYGFNIKDYPLRTIVVRRRRLNNSCPRVRARQPATSNLKPIASALMRADRVTKSDLLVIVRSPRRSRETAAAFRAGNGARATESVNDL